MLTNGELALLAPLFGLIGAVSGSLITWIATNSASRRQQQIDANQRRYDRRSEVYENVLTELTRSVMDLEDRLKNNPDREPAVPDEQAKRDEARWRARGVLLSSAKVRAAHRDWAKVFVARFSVTGETEPQRELARLEWLARIALATDEVGKAMAADLEELSELPRPPHRSLFFPPPQD